MKGETVSADVFDVIVKLYCVRWEDRSIEVVRSLLVDSLRISIVAHNFGVSTQHANVLRGRFKKYLADYRSRNALKMDAEAFMNAVAPDQNTALDAYRDEIKKLLDHGYSNNQILHFLQTNNVTVTEDQIQQLRGNL
jgi:hypothetical protein